MNKLISNLPKGPLDAYRKRATFDWKKLKLHLDGVDFIEFQNSLWNFIQKTPEFQDLPISSLDDERRICNKRVRAITDNQIADPVRDGVWFNILFMYDGSIPVKMGIMNAMVPHTILALGNEYHHRIVNKLSEGQYTGCFVLTEIAHGTNVKGMRATATYDVKSKSFILHTPDFEAAKCWAGGLAKTATHALIFAQLVTPDGAKHGLHIFVVPIRDPKTLLPMPGVIIGDLGEKAGLNGVDNGFIMFNNYRIDRRCLLNKTADVTEDGKYIPRIKEQSKRMGASLGALSGGRITITAISSNYASLAIVIAMRYCAARKQFGPNETEEWSVIEYQAQQWRLFPHLAAAYALKIFSTVFNGQLREFQMKRLMGEDQDNSAALGMEIHALSTAAKPLCSWTARDIIQDCRESCGGHGYLKMSRLGDIRSDNDANCTYDGENNVLIQQASNWLLNQWEHLLSGKKIDYPLDSANFLNDANHILSRRFAYTTIEDTMKPENLLFIFKWLICYYLKTTYEQLRKLKAEGYSDFETRNNSQVFFAQTLSLLYAQHAIVQSFIRRIEDPVWEVNERRVLTKLCSLYAAAALEKRLGDLYSSGYAKPESRLHTLLREGSLNLCKDLVPDVVSLVDVLAPPDFIVRSPLGRADGDIYNHMKEWIFRNKECFERPTWWKEIIQAKL